jgi:hypothetical protein
VKAVTDLPWRTGRKVTRHVYAVEDNDPSDDDVEVAVAVGDGLVADGVARRIVADHNAALGSTP